MRFDVISLFPAMFDALRHDGVCARALTAGIWSLDCWNPRDQTTDNYHRVDDRPYGGGPGMVMLAAPLTQTLERVQQAQQQASVAPTRVVYLSPHGAVINQRKIEELGALPGLTLIAGRYEALDQRFIDSHVDEQVSIGDFVVSGGELPAMLLMDALVRRLPGVLNDPASVTEESFVNGLLDHPHYTRPESVAGQQVPAVLLSGNHAKIDRWRRDQSLALTFRLRPDLIQALRRRGGLSRPDEVFLAALVARAK